MTTISITQLYSLLYEKVGKETAENLTVYIESKIKDEVKLNSETLATKSDLASVELKLSNQICDSRAEMIKWMFIFWIGQVAVTFGFILLFLKR